MGVVAASSRRSSRHDERRGVLLATAAQMINALGAGAISLNDIAAQIGLSRNALYHYVADRTKLVFECYRQTCEAALADLADAVDVSPDEGEQLRRFIELGLAYDRPVSAVLSDHYILPEPQRWIILDLRRRQIEGLTAIVNAGIGHQRFRPCDAELVAQALVGMLSWAQLSAAWLAHRDGPESRARATSAMQALLMDGLAAPGQRLPTFPTLFPQAFNAFDRQAAADAKAEQLIAAASRLFNQRGIVGVSLDDIGASVGATKGVVYHYFPDKPALVERCLERAFALYDDYVAIAIRQEPSGFVRAMTVHHLNAQAQAGPIAPMLLQPGYDSLPAPARGEFSGRAQRLWQTTAGLIEAGIADGSCRPCDAMATAEIAAGAFFWLPKWRQMGDTAAAVSIADALADTVAFGIAAG